MKAFSSSQSEANRGAAAKKGEKGIPARQAGREMPFFADIPAKPGHIR
ncbi:hypothetical protein NYE48_20045 [Paenibacillus sp. FSL M7-1455]|jgi:hypothetical protein